MCGLFISGHQCFCFDLEENNDFRAFVINSALNNKLGEETRHIYQASGDNGYFASLVSLFKFCLGRVWLEGKRKFHLLRVKGVALFVGAHHDSSFNRAVKLPSKTQCWPPCPGGSHRGPGWNNLGGDAFLLVRSCIGTWAGTLAELQQSFLPELPTSAHKPRTALKFLHSILLWEACGSSITVCLSKQIEIEEKGSPSGDFSRDEDVF